MRRHTDFQPVEESPVVFGTSEPADFATGGDPLSGPCTRANGRACATVYGYIDDQDDLHIKELSRSGYGEPGPSPGDALERETTKSTLDDGLPELLIPV
ncbi:hypothetical protein [Salinibaculum salinum]|uniref:hypothetical protein n=1 Tax=Salinibaculum salinum TaxID=3131996 RepID=UPI0030EC61E3